MVGGLPSTGLKRSAIAQRFWQPNTPMRRDGKNQRKRQNDFRTPKGLVNPK
jgi:hypothetical protein